MPNFWADFDERFSGLNTFEQTGNASLLVDRDFIQRAEAGPTFASFNIRNSHDTHIFSGRSCQKNHS
jgi:hypothetical protein